MSENISFSFTCGSGVCVWSQVERDYNDGPLFKKLWKKFPSQIFEFKFLVFHN